MTLFTGFLHEIGFHSIETSVLHFLAYTGGKKTPSDLQINKQLLCSIIPTTSQKQNLCLLNPEYINRLYICIQLLITTQHSATTVLA